MYQRNGHKSNRLKVLNEATQVLSLQLGLTIDTLVRDMMVSTASTIACVNGLNGNTPTEITDADIQAAVIALRQGNARLMTNPLPGEDFKLVLYKPNLIDLEILAA